MQVNWLIQYSAFEREQLDLLEAAIVAAGHKFTELWYRPFGAGFQEYDTRKPLVVPTDSPVLYYGTINGLKHLYRYSGGKPLAWVDFEDVTCMRYYPKWAEFLLQKKYLMLPLQEIYRNKTWLYDVFGGKTREMFIRPDDNAKSFCGEKVYEEEFDKWKMTLEANGVGLSTLSVVSKMEPIQKEYRLVMVDGKVLTGSTYRVGGELIYSNNISESLIVFAEKLAAIWNPYPVYCLDIAEYEDQYSLVEISAINTSGLYDCDLNKIADVVSGIAIREFELQKTISV